LPPGCSFFDDDMEALEKTLVQRLQGAGVLQPSVTCSEEFHDGGRKLALQVRYQPNRSPEVRCTTEQELNALAPYLCEHITQFHKQQQQRELEWQLEWQQRERELQRQRHELERQQRELERQQRELERQQALQEAKARREKLEQQLISAGAELLVPKKERGDAEPAPQKGQRRGRFGKEQIPAISAVAVLAKAPAAEAPAAETPAARCARLLRAMDLDLEEAVVEYISGLMEDDACDDIDGVCAVALEILEGHGVDHGVAETFWRRLWAA